MRVNRGTLTEPGKNSPFRDRSVDENLDLFRRMKAGEFPNGARVLRAKIDMASGNINLRDPVLYRILKAPHPRTGTTWSIYPSYDFAHGQSDAIEGITHSICTLEFEDHRPLYDWFLDNLPVPSQPHQYEFARLNLTYTVLSKRVLTTLVRDGHVNGWDDPRMPTLAGLRRRGVPPGAIRDFVKRIGVAKANSVVDAGMLDFSIREALNKTALRRMAVLRPLKVVIENYPEGQSEELDAVNHPDDPDAGSRKITFGREIYIERDDFMENPPKKFFRLSPGTEVRLRYAYFITCREAVKNAAGEVDRAALHLRSGDPRRQRARRPQGEGDDPLGVGGGFQAGRGAASTIRCSPSPIPSGGEGFAADLNPHSLEVLSDARLEPALAAAASRRAGAVRAAGLFRAAIRIRRRTAWCSIAPSDCVIHSPRRSAARADPGGAIPAGSCLERVARAGALRMADWGRGRRQQRGRVGTWDAARAASARARLGRRVPDFGRAAAEHLRNWAVADTGPGRLLPWLPVAFGLGIAIYFTADREPAWWAGSWSRRWSCCVVAFVGAAAADRRSRSRSPAPPSPRALRWRR